MDIVRRRAPPDPSCYHDANNWPLLRGPWIPDLIGNGKPSPTYQPSFGSYQSARRKNSTPGEGGGHRLPAKPVSPRAVL